MKFAHLEGVPNNPILRGLSNDHHRYFHHVSASWSPDGKSPKACEDASTVFRWVQWMVAWLNDDESMVPSSLWWFWVKIGCVVFWLWRLGWWPFFAYEVEVCIFIDTWWGGWLFLHGWFLDVEGRCIHYIQLEGSKNILPTQTLR